MRVLAAPCKPLSLIKYTCSGLPEFVPAGHCVHRLHMLSESVDRIHLLRVFMEYTCCLKVFIQYTCYIRLPEIVYIFLEATP